MVRVSPAPTADAKPMSSAKDPAATAIEPSSALERVFRKFDKDGDGEVQIKELESMLEELRRARPGHFHRSGVCVCAACGV